MNKIYFLLLFPLMVNCQTEKKAIEYPKMIGDIDFNEKIDDSNFVLCKPLLITHYFVGGKGVKYEGEKIELDNTFFQRYKNQNITGETGLIRINFIVNCQGETDRFRIISMDNNYNEKIFDERITSQLFSITKNLKGWIPIENKDYYQYLIFKIVNGNLIEIMP